MKDLDRPEKLVFMCLLASLTGSLAAVLLWWFQ